MNDFQAWKKFITTGKVKDYMNYKNVNESTFTDIKGVTSENEYKDRRNSSERSSEGQAKDINTFN